VGFFNSLKKWFSSEAAELKESASEAKSRLEAEMDRREAESRATPEQKLEQIQSEIADDPFSEVRNKIGEQQAHADAVDELQAAERSDASVEDEP
jgi:hypothetical protein